MQLKNLNILNKILDTANREVDIEEKLRLLSIASYFATYNYIGAIYSNEIEDNLIFISNNMIGNSLKTEKINKNSCLHVVTEFYLNGGHSRVVERWMDFDNNLENSVVILKPEYSQISNKLQKHNIYKINEKNYIDKAKALLKISKNYEYIILHTHMYDIIPLLAYGNKNLKSKIFYYNQADHIFWIGRNIADKILDISKEGQEVTKLYRNIIEDDKSMVLPIPLDIKTGIKKNYKKINNIKNELNIDLDTKVIVTAGTTTRFITDDYSIIDVFNSIESRLSNFIFIIIGSNEKDSFWKNIKNDNRVKIVDKIPKDIFDKYVSMADIYIESFPFSSSTSSLEMIMNDVISILVEDDFPQFDSYVNFTQKREDIAKNVIKILTDIQYRESYSKQQDIVKDKIVKEHFKEAWTSKKNNVFLNMDIKKEFEIKGNKLLKYNDNLIKFLSKSYPNHKLYKEDFFKLNFFNKIKIIENIGMKSLIKKLFNKLV